jgi:type I restriction enzyme M protein
MTPMTLLVTTFHGNPERWVWLHPLIGVTRLPTIDAREAKTHFELHRAIQNVIQRGESPPGIGFARSEPEYPIPGDGFADLVVYDRDSFPWLVIETKATTKAGDPYNPKVINQALGYASSLGAHYFATCDGQSFVLFDNKERGVPFWERKRLPPYDIAGKNLEAFVTALFADLNLLEEGARKWSGIDSAFVDRLKFLHQRFVPYLQRSLKQRALDDTQFKVSLEKWLKERGHEYDEVSQRKTAVEAAYLLINRILFYKVLEPQYPEILEKLTRLPDSAQVGRALAKLFARVTDKIDYEAVYEPSIFGEIPIPPALAEIVNDFLEEASDYDLSRVESDVLGRIYEGLIPPAERKDLGQYYTPPPICDLLVRMCVTGPNNLVLDPGCGSGGFLIKAYYQLLRLKGKSAPDPETHRAILSQLYGVDISQFPAHLSVINLALRDITAHLRASDVINVLPTDFFKTEPLQKKLTPTVRARLGKEGTAFGHVPLVDAVVCNPPYTRQDDIGDEGYRKQMRDVALTFSGRTVDISTEAGIYAYFFTHATHFLKEGGRMGFIVSNSWMDVRFGVEIQGFLLDNFRIKSILEFEKRVFEEAAINTVDVVLEKASGLANSRDRDRNVVKFVRVKKPMSVEDIVRTIDQASEPSETEEARITLVPQSVLRKDHKWLKYLRAPRCYFELLQNSRVTRMADMGDINVGIITYANSFFILPKADAKKHWGIENQFLRPITTSPKDLHYLDLRPEDVGDVLFYVNKPKDELGETNARRYIEWGESARVPITRGATKGSSVKGYQRVPSLKNRALWYSVGEREPAPILFPRLMWERLFVARNAAGALANDRFYEVRLESADSVEVLLGYLNSTIGRLCMEVCGRTTLGEGGLEFMKYELDEFPVIRIESLSNKEAESISSAYRELESAQRDAKMPQILQKSLALDAAVTAALKLVPADLAEMERSLGEMHSMRTTRTNVEVMIQHAEGKSKLSRPARQKKLKSDSSQAKPLEDFD